MVWAPADVPRILLQLQMDQWAVILTILALGLILKAVILWWLYRDTTARDHQPWGWLVAAFFLDIPTLIVWLIVRNGDAYESPPNHASPPAKQAPVAPQDSPRHDEPVDPDLPVGPRVFQEPAAPEPPLTHVTPPDAPSAGKRILVTCPYCSTQFTTLSSPTGPTAVTCPSCGERGVVPESSEKQ